MPFAREAFATLGEAVVVPDRAITRETVRDADILAVRSTTKVDRALLEGSRVRFVGTATIGFDHIDTEYLAGRGIAWCAAPGCNANSVSEYVTAALLCLARRHGFRLREKTLGVVGVGNVGRLVAQKAVALGMRVLVNDPPRERAEGNGDVPFLPLSKVLQRSDVVTVHVPLNASGTDRTVGLADAEFFAAMKPRAIFLNAARGQVVDTEALVNAIERDQIAHAVIDTWNPEPAFPADLLQRADLSTPHIAGHSWEGKVNGTVLVYRSVCRFLDASATWSPDALMPASAVPRIEADARRRDAEDLLQDIVSRVYDIEEDDRQLRAGASADDAARAQLFEGLRRNYPVRREFPATRVALKNTQDSLAATLAGLGFKTA